MLRLFSSKLKKALTVGFYVLLTVLDNVTEQIVTQRNYLLRHHFFSLALLSYSYYFPNSFDLFAAASMPFKGIFEFSLLKDRNAATVVRVRRDARQQDHRVFSVNDTIFAAPTTVVRTSLAPETATNHLFPRRESVDDIVDVRGPMPVIAVIGFCRSRAPNRTARPRKDLFCQLCLDLGTCGSS
jgi:hypothetical protein